MMPIDMTVQMAPMINGMIVLLVVSAVAVFAEPASRVLSAWFRSGNRPRTMARPAMGHSR